MSRNDVETLKRAIDYLVAARASLGKSRPRTDALIARIQAVGGKLNYTNPADYFGNDPLMVRGDLAAILGDLGWLKELPGAGDAISSVQKALALLSDDDGED